jgi:hypothetical protein
MSDSAARATGKWHRTDVPHSGWKCIDIEDLGRSSAVCEMCEAQDIRYVHSMEHASYATALRCGCVCAGRMEGSTETAKKREAILRSASTRRQNWLTRKWSCSRQEGAYLRAGGYSVYVFPSGDQSWTFRVRDRKRGGAVESRETYSTMDRARLKAFDIMTLMKCYDDAAEE